MTRLATRFLFLVCAGVLVSACAPSLRVTRLKPSRVNLGATRSVAVLQVNGEPRAASQTIVELQRNVVDGRYYQLINAINRGILLPVGGGNYVDVGYVRSQLQADVYLVASVLRSEFVEERRTSTRTENGRSIDVVKLHPKGYARVNFQVVMADGRVVVFRDYVGEHEGAGYERQSRVSVRANDYIDEAIRRAVAAFVADITPRRVVEYIELDDSEPALKPGIKLAQDGNLAAAESSWMQVLARQPRSAGATYNLGVLLETRGEFDEADAAYRKAIELSPKALYRDALRDMRRRLYEAQALQTPL